MAYSSGPKPPGSASLEVWDPVSSVKPKLSAFFSPEEGKYCSYFYSAKRIYEVWRDAPLPRKFHSNYRDILRWCFTPQRLTMTTTNERATQPNDPLRAQWNFRGVPPKQANRYFRLSLFLSNGLNLDDNGME